MRRGSNFVRLDSTASRDFDGYEFISHAHTDHLSAAHIRKRVLCTEETSVIAAMRGLKVEMSQPPPGFRMVRTGHILGSAGLQIDDSFFYTGDIKLRTYSSEPASIPRVRHLLIESTYGSSAFRFPDPSEVLSQALDEIKYFIARGMPCVLMGYSLGKAQHLQIFFDDRVTCQKYITQDIDAYNDIYRLFGKEVAEKRVITRIPAQELTRDPWILYHPMRSGRDPFLAYLRRRYGAVLASFTGWALRREYAAANNTDLAYPLSDHADFQELCAIAEMAEPETVSVLEGHSHELVQELRELGYAASEVPNNGTRLDI